MLRHLNRGPLIRQQCGARLTTLLALQNLPPTSHLLIRYNPHQSRRLGGIPTILLPPVVFGGLVVALWTWKCAMMVIFQNKIIYMPGLPPNARRETISEYDKQCSGIQWREERIQSLDETCISICVASVEHTLGISLPVTTVYILYFQGNASSLPSRLPLLSPVLRVLRARAANQNIAIKYILVCCSYRGYWTSKGRPSEKGIAKDAAAALQWIQIHNDSQTQAPKAPRETPVVIWGQSIGAGVASNLAAGKQPFTGRLALKTLILETPFLSVRSMLETLYPQKWLPYRYLYPFLRNHLDSWQALGKIKEKFGNASPHVLLLVAGKDELVPASHGKDLEKRCLDIGLHVQRKVIGGALHTEVMVRQEGLSAVVNAIEKITKRG